MSHGQLSCPSVSLLCKHILVLHAGCTTVVTRNIVTQFKSTVCTEDKKGRKVGTVCGSEEREVHEL